MILRNKYLRHVLLPVRRESPKVLWNFPKKIARRSITGRRSSRSKKTLAQATRDFFKYKHLLMQQENLMERRV